MSERKIGHLRDKGYYVCKPNPDYNKEEESEWDVLYLHRDLRWYTRCGTSNFYKTLEEAQYYISLEENKNKPFLTEKEMII